MHVVHRGNNRTTTFLSASELQRYRDVLQQASHRFRCAIHAYVLMTNHVHLLITPEDDTGPARMMQLIGRKYVRYVNALRHRTGTLWEGRFRSTLINSDRYFLTCSRYVELNPVRAGMAADADQYRWSSHRHNAYGDPDPLITPHQLYVALGATPADRQAGYRALFQTPIESSTLEQIRRATNRGGRLCQGSESLL